MRPKLLGDRERDSVLAVHAVYLHNDAHQGRESEIRKTRIVRSQTCWSGDRHGDLIHAARESVHRSHHGRDAARVKFVDINVHGKLGYSVALGERYGTDAGRENSNPVAGRGGIRRRV